MTVPLRFGYKASAEQFGPNELLEFGVLAEEMGFDSVFVSDHLQPWLHEGGHAPASVPWLGALGARTSRIMIGTSVLTPTFRYNPTVIAQDFATLGVMYPGPRHPRRRHRRGAQRGEPGHRLARPARALPAPQGGDRPHPAALVRGPRHVRGHLLHDAQHHDLRQARPAGADLHRRGRSRGDPARGPDRGRLHHHIGQDAGALHRDAAARAARRARRRPDARPTRSTPSSRSRSRTTPTPTSRSRRPASGRRSRSRAEEKMGVDDPHRDAAARRAAADRARGIALHRLGRPRRARRVDLAVHRPRLPPPRLPRSRARPGGVPPHVRRRDPAAAARAVSASDGRAGRSSSRSSRPSVGKSRLEVPTRSTGWRSPGRSRSTRSRRRPRARPSAQVSS